MFLLSEVGHVGELLDLPQWCQGPFGVSRGKVGFLSRRPRRKGPQLALRGESPGFSRVAVGFLWSEDGDLRDPHMGLMEVQSPRESRGAPRDSSAVDDGAEVFSWS